MPTRNRILGWALLIQAVASGLAVRVSAGDASSPAPSAVDVEFFERRVRPILASRCFECHAASASKQRGGLWLDSREAILSGGDSGPAAVPGSADESLLIQAIRYDSEGIQMPPAGQLPLREREILEEWVRRGLPFPAVAAAAARKARVDVAEGRQHWAYQPLRPVTLPQAVGEHAGWDVRRTDRFIAAGHAAHELVPAPSAPRRSFLRRVKLDLLGLPPDPDEIVAFEQDESPQACERLVDRLLADPAYGERWGRHWLDLARYCDVPESWREGQGQPWLYRDWVIRSLNEDLGYNQFVRRQLAADLLDDTQPADNAALGFIGLSPTYWKELKLDHLVIQQVVAEEWEERMDALGSTFLGLTLACARCHDHKYDAITIDDYYALAGVLASVRLEDRSILPGDQTRVADEGRQRIGWLQQQIDKLLASKPVSAAARQQADELRREMDEVRRTTPGLEIPLACGLSDAALHVLPVGENRTRLEYRPGEALDLAIHIRGNPANRGPVVARRFLSVLAADSPPPFRRGSGRLDLADALVGEAGPLLARVMVNRVWAHHFGRGLVATPSNFGVQGDPPTHPELLEDLAHRFVDHGWSLKWLHRE
ncbi:MAG: PSD1 and planctomycete cytochrome C domain-containing protein, partial [Pirellulaceae bacterium]